MADFVFIDGAHDYESMKKDIQACKRILRPGGIICGHDFDRWCTVIGLQKYPHLQIGPDNIHYGVIKAVSECFENFFMVENDPSFGLPQSCTIWVWKDEPVGLPDITATSAATAL